MTLNEAAAIPQERDAMNATDARYEVEAMDMAEAIVWVTTDTWTGEVVDQRTEWKPGFGE